MCAGVCQSSRVATVRLQNAGIDSLSTMSAARLLAALMIFGRTALLFLVLSGRKRSVIFFALLRCRVPQIARQPLLVGIKLCGFGSVITHQRVPSAVGQHRPITGDCQRPRKHAGGTMRERSLNVAAFSMQAAGIIPSVSCMGFLDRTRRGSRPLPSFVQVRANGQAPPEPLIPDLFVRSALSP